MLSVTTVCGFSPGCRLRTSYRARSQVCSRQIRKHGKPVCKLAKNRLHMDVRVAGTGSAGERWTRITEAVDRLTVADATALQEFPGHHVVMADPEGNEFCVC